MELKWRPEGAQMPPKFDPENQIKGTPSQDPSKGGFWMDLGSTLGRVWEALGALGGPDDAPGVPNRDQNRGILWTFRASLPGFLPGIVLARKMSDMGADFLPRGTQNGWIRGLLRSLAQSCTTLQAASRIHETALPVLCTHRFWEHVWEHFGVLDP